MRVALCVLMTAAALRAAFLVPTGDRGAAGEFYPCRSDIFEATYEPAD